MKRWVDVSSYLEIATVLTSFLFCSRCINDLWRSSLVLLNPAKSRSSWCKVATLRSTFSQLEDESSRLTPKKHPCFLDPSYFLFVFFVSFRPSFLYQNNLFPYLFVSCSSSNSSSPSLNLDFILVLESRSHQSLSIVHYSVPFFPFHVFIRLPNEMSRFTDTVAFSDSVYDKQTKKEELEPGQNQDRNHNREVFLWTCHSKRINRAPLYLFCNSIPFTLVKKRFKEKARKPDHSVAH